LVTEAYAYYATQGVAEIIRRWDTKAFATAIEGWEPSFVVSDEDVGESPATGHSSEAHDPYWPLTSFQI